jgi:hypothetical protein
LPPTIENGLEEVFFALEIVVDQTVRNAGFLGNIGHPRLVEAFLLEDREGRIKDERLFGGFERG